MRALRARVNQMMFATRTHRRCHRKAEHLINLIVINRKVLIMPGPRHAHRFSEDRVEGRQEIIGPSQHVPNHLPSVILLTHDGHLHVGRDLSLPTKMETGKPSVVNQNALKRFQALRSVNRSIQEESIGDSDAPDFFEAFSKKDAVGFNGEDDVKGIVGEREGTNVGANKRDIGVGLAQVRRGKGLSAGNSLQANRLKTRSIDRIRTEHTILATRSVQKKVWRTILG